MEGAAPGHAPAAREGRALVTIIGKFGGDGLVHCQFPAPSSRGPALVWVRIPPHEARARGVRVFAAARFYR
jgi:hypothetical protein